MNVTCPKCGTAVSADQAFCPKCGAVQGATHQPREDSGFNMAATMVGQKFPMPPSAPKPPANPPANVAANPPVQRAAPPPPPFQPPPAPTRPAASDHMVSPPAAPAVSASGNRALYLILGLFAVLVLGGILAFFVYVIFSGS